MKDKLCLDYADMKYAVMGMYVFTKVRGSYTRNFPQQVLSVVVMPVGWSQIGRQALRRDKSGETLPM